MIKSLFFDVDGTLIDSNDLHADAWAEAFRHFGIDIPRGRIRHEVGKGGDNLIPSLLPGVTEEQQERIETYRSALFKRDYRPAITVFPDVRALFERAARDGKGLFLATSSGQEDLEYFIELMGIGEVLTGTVSASDADSSKPDPDIFAAALEKAGASADECLVIGDTPWDAIAAAKAGLRTIGFRSGGFPDDELRGSGVIALYDGPSDLLQRYDTSPIVGT